jgi:hypothetical protein
VRKGQVWQFERDRPSKEDDPRTPYRVVVSADYWLPPWLTGPVGMITMVTLDALAVALRTEMDL